MKLVVLCDFPYWRKTVGTAVRHDSLCRSLARVCDLTVISTVSLHAAERKLLHDLPYRLIDRADLTQIHKAIGDRPLPGVVPARQMELQAIRHYCLESGADAVLTPYFNRYWMIEHLPATMARVIDTHDCQSQRTRSFARHGMTPTFVMTLEEEGRKLDLYDLVLAISDEDHQEFRTMTARPILTAPFRLPVNDIHFVNPKSRDLLFIAAKSPVNDATLVYLLRDILPLVGRQLTLHVVGSVTLPKITVPGVRLVHHERVDELSEIYSRVALAVNPTYAGGGVKTKTLEAISFGVPVLTTDEGARGLRQLLPDGLIANDKETFAYRIRRLLDHPDERRQLAAEMGAALANEDSESWTGPFLHLLTAACAARRERLGA